MLENNNKQSSFSFKERNSENATKSTTMQQNMISNYFFADTGKFINLRLIRIVCVILFFALTISYSIMQDYLFFKEIAIVMAVCFLALIGKGNPVKIK